MEGSVEVGPGEGRGQTGEGLPLPVDRLEDELDLFEGGLLVLAEVAEHLLHLIVRHSI